MTADIDMISKELIIIEDDSRFRASIKLILAGDGYSFVEASSIESGLQAITGREGPHVVLLDLQLPDGNGTTLRKTPCESER